MAQNDDITDAEPEGPSRDIRLHVDVVLADQWGEGMAVDLPREAAHYLFSVMRASVGDRILAFNNRDGEWLIELVSGSKRNATAALISQTRPAAPPPDIWLLFAPIKKARTDFIVEKAAEVGCRRILPVRTRRTQSDRLNQERLQAHAVEAAEQCGGVYVPEVAELQTLDAVLRDWDPARCLIFCDEMRDAPPLASQDFPEPAAILIGPEGGFTPEEAERLKAQPFTSAVSLGPRVLRADTAAVAAIALWQQRNGDWGQ